MKYEFVVHGRGDESVGIWPSFFRVTFDFEVEIDDEEIKRIKEWLRDFDDNLTTVYTKEEYDKRCEEEDKYYKEMEKEEEMNNN